MIPPKPSALFYERVYAPRRVRAFQALIAVWLVVAWLSVFVRTPNSLGWEILTFIPFPLFFLALVHFFVWTPLTIHIDEEALIVRRGGLIAQRRHRVLLRDVCGLQMISFESALVHKKAVQGEQQAAREFGSRRTLEIELRRGACVMINTLRSGEIASLLREQTGVPIKDRIQVRS